MGFFEGLAKKIGYGVIIIIFIAIVIGIIYLISIISSHIGEYKGLKNKVEESKYSENREPKNRNVELTR